jgi:hypothetical protein
MSLTNVVTEDETKLLSSPTSTESFALFSEHLLFDSQAMIGGLFGDEHQIWTPSSLDDRVMSTELEEMMQQEQVRQDDTWLQQYLCDLL